MRWLGRLALTLALLAGIMGATVLYLPLRVTIADVATQPAAPLPDAFRVALRYALAEDGAPWQVRQQAAKLIASRAPPDGVMRLVVPLLLAVRLSAFTDITQSERFVAHSYRPRCWTKDDADLTVPEALYLAARMNAPALDDEVFIRGQMARIAERARIANDVLAPALIAAAADPLPTCN